MTIISENLSRVHTIYNLGSSRQFFRNSGFSASALCNFGLFTQVSLQLQGPQQRVLPNLRHFNGSSYTTSGSSAAASSHYFRLFRFRPFPFQLSYFSSLNSSSSATSGLQRQVFTTSGSSAAGSSVTQAPRLQVLLNFGLSTAVLYCLRLLSFRLSTAGSSTTGSSTAGSSTTALQRGFFHHFRFLNFRNHNPISGSSS